MFRFEYILPKYETFQFYWNFNLIYFPGSLLYNGRTIPIRRVGAGFDIFSDNVYLLLKVITKKFSSERPKFRSSQPTPKGTRNHFPANTATAATTADQPTIFESSFFQSRHLYESKRLYESRRLYESSFFQSRCFYNRNFFKQFEVWNSSTVIWICDKSAKSKIILNENTKTANIYYFYVYLLGNVAIVVWLK